MWYCHFILKMNTTWLWKDMLPLVMSVARRQQDKNRNWINLSVSNFCFLTPTLIHNSLYCVHTPLSLRPPHVTNSSHHLVFLKYSKIFIPPSFWWAVEFPRKPLLFLPLQMYLVKPAPIPCAGWASPQPPTHAPYLEGSYTPLLLLKLFTGHKQWASTLILINYESRSLPSSWAPLLFSIKAEIT